MKKRFLFIVPVLAIAAAFIKNVQFFPQADGANASAAIATSVASAAEPIDQPMINLLPKSRRLLKTMHHSKPITAKKASSMTPSEAFPNRPVTLASKEARIRKEVSKEEIDAVLYQGRPAEAAGNQPIERPMPGLPAAQDNDSNSGALDTQGRWISKLSGETAILNVQNKKAIECSNPHASCATLNHENEVSVVGVVVVSQAQQSSLIPEPMKGRVRRGNKVDDTPAVYID